MPGKSELHQLQLICELLGTPTEQQWPALPSLLKQDVNTSLQLPQITRDNATFHSKFQDILTPSGIDLLSRMLIYDPARRITANKH